LRYFTRFYVPFVAGWYVTAAICSCACVVAVAQDVPAYRDAKLPVEERVGDLIGRMTLQEKVAQMEGTWQNRGNLKDASQLFVDEKGVFLPERAGGVLKNGLGQMSRPSEQHGPRAMAEFTNTIQKWMKENTRLGVPMLFHEECLHGHAALGGTSFPQAIALAATWDEALVQDIFSSVASEVRARGAQQCLAPVLDLARDPRSMVFRAKARTLIRHTSWRLPNILPCTGSPKVEPMLDRGIIPSA
jgi:beta-glucosidase